MKRLIFLIGLIIVVSLVSTSCESSNDELNQLRIENPTGDGTIDGNGDGNDGGSGGNNPPPGNG